MKQITIKSYQLIYSKIYTTVYTNNNVMDDHIHSPTKSNCLTSPFEDVFSPSSMSRLNEEAQSGSSDEEREKGMSSKLLFGS